MKSNVCKIENGTRDLELILKESRKVAEYNELTHKQELQLRLICEEIDGMLPNIIDDFNGDFWIEFVDGVCKVNASVEFEGFTADKKDALISIAKNKKNAYAVGIVGKIRSGIESIFLDEEAVMLSSLSSSTLQWRTGVDYSYLWSLDQYRNLVQNDKQEEAWDELEKSVIASVADDVIVGVKGKRADIVITKRFA